MNNDADQKTKWREFDDTELLEYIAEFALEQYKESK